MITVQKRDYRLGIIEIEMYERDNKIRDWIIAKIKDNNGREIKLRLVDIAQQFNCTRLTARRVITRLAAAQKINIRKSSNRDGYYYSLR